MRNNQIIRTLPAVALTIGKKRGIEIVVNGSVAGTSGSKIVIPQLPENDTAWTLARGYIDHESAHIKETDMYTFQSASDKERPLLNIIEDIRCEKIISDRFPGCAVNLKNLVKVLTENGHFGISEDAGVKDTFYGWILTQGRSDYLNHKTLLPNAEKAESTLRKTIGDSLLDETRKLMGKIPSLRNTTDSLDLTRDILKLIKDEQAKKQSKPEEKSEDKNSDEQGGGSNEQDKQPMDDFNQMPSENEAKRFSIGSAAEQSLKTESSLSTPTNTAGLLPSSELASESKLVEFDHLKVRRETSGIKSKLARVIESKRLKRTYNKRTGRYIDTRKIYKLVNKDFRVFHASEEKTSPNTAVSILLDRSASMSGEPMKKAREAAFAISDALDSIKGVSTSVTAFPGKSKKVAKITDFDETAIKTKVSYGIEPDGGTPMLQAMRWSSVHMSLREEPRKIMIVITDGVAREPSLIKTFSEKLSKNGIEVFGIGIGYVEVLSNVFDNFILIDSASDLKDSLFKLFTKHLK